MDNDKSTMLAVLQLLRKYNLKVFGKEFRHLNCSNLKHLYKH